MGAAHVVAHPRADREFAQVVGDPGKSLPGAPPHYPRGFDVVVIAAGSQSALAASVTWVRAGGQVLLLGGVGTARIDWTPVWSRRLQITGSYGYGESGADTFRAVLSLFSVMSRPLEALVTHRFLLGQYRAAIHTIMAGHDVIKAVFAPNADPSD
jgi:threonine dehydrogenase-like Zn-dependent dehydrogenase